MTTDPIDQTHAESSAAIAALRSQFAAARAWAATWEPRPAPDRTLLAPPVARRAVEERGVGIPHATAVDAHPTFAFGMAEFAVVLAISLCPPALLAWGIQRGVGR